MTASANNFAEAILELLARGADPNIKSNVMLFNSGFITLSIDNRVLYLINCYRGCNYHR